MVPFTPGAVWPRSEKMRKTPIFLPVLSAADGAGWRVAAFALAILFAGTGGQARDHHVAAPGMPPVAAPDGSATAPWPDIAAAVRAGALSGGDRVLLAEGQHGALALGGLHFDTPVVFAPAPGAAAHLDRLVISDASGLVVRDIRIWPLAPGRDGVRGRPTLVSVDESARDIVLERLDIRGGPHALDYYDWPRSDWLEDWRWRGVAIGGDDVTLRDSTLTAVALGIGVGGARARVIGNEIRGFSRDGLRGFGDGSVFRGNVVRDCVKVDGNHDDGFQSFVAPPGRPGPKRIRDITLDGNAILEWTGPPDHPLRCTLQGIALFDGPYENWTIQNNLVVVRAPHGIAIYAGQGMQVVYNTVVHPAGVAGKKPWIMQSDGKRGQGSRDNVFYGNVATAFRLGPDGNRWTRYNIRADSVVRLFEAPETGDYRPRRSGPLVDGRANPHSPSHDLRGVARPLGGGPDLGAFERRD